MFEVHTSPTCITCCRCCPPLQVWAGGTLGRKKTGGQSQPEPSAVMSLLEPEELLARELSCPICFQFFADPVTLPCGHNYCRGCIEATASVASHVGSSAPRCPECRLEFPNVETLQRNFKLCSIVDGFKASQSQRCADGPVEMPGDEGVRRDPCLQYDASLCTRHFQKHHGRESFAVDVHPSGAPRSCATHRRPLEYFCSTDVTLLCAGCFIEGHHQNHDVLTFGAAEEEMRRALEGRTKVLHVSRPLRRFIHRKV